MISPDKNNTQPSNEIIAVSGGPLSLPPHSAHSGPKFHSMLEGDTPLSGPGPDTWPDEAPSHVSTPRKVIREIIV